MRTIYQLCIFLLISIFLKECKFVKGTVQCPINRFNCFESFLGEAIWCYRCTSATPGCAETFNWRGIGYWGAQCPEDDDICVKLTERKGGIFFYFHLINFLYLKLICLYFSVCNNNKRLSEYISWFSYWCTCWSLRGMSQSC